MLYGIEGILNGKLFGNDEGGSSSGGIILPTLTNPAGADQILEGYEAVDGSGNKLTGTHVCESGGGGVGVAPQIDHGYGYLTFTPYENTTIPAGSAKQRIEFGSCDRSNEPTTSDLGYGYIYGHPEITVHKDYAMKYDHYIHIAFNSSATDFTFKTDETYTLVFLYHE